MNLLRDPLSISPTPVHELGSQRHSASLLKTNPPTPPIGKRQQTPAFLEKLFDILEDDSPYASLIGWQPDGKSFIIKKANEFSEIVLPKYFKHSNMQSYIRQLNMYGFSKTRHDSNHHEFTHALFQRGRRDLLMFIRRKMQQNTQRLPKSGLLIGLPLKDKTNSEELIEDEDLSTDDNRMSQSVASEVLGVALQENSILESRVLTLESQLKSLTSHCIQLTEQHNLLCSMLQSNHALHLKDRSAELSSKTDSSESNSNSAVDDRPLKRMKSYDHSPSLLLHDKNISSELLESFRDTDYHRYKSTCPDKLYASVDRERKLSGCTDSEQSSFSTNKKESKNSVSTNLVKSFSVEMCGLEAITSAAYLLDYHMNGKTSKDNNSLGAPLTKSFSIG